MRPFIQPLKNPHLSHALLLSLLSLCGCVNTFHVRENLSEEQILDTKIIRKPTGEKSWGILPLYQDFLEGYIRGGLVDADAQAIQGVPVKVQDEKGKELSEFSHGITDSAGIYKIRFSLPVRWDRIDFTGNLSCGPNWKIVTPQTQFRIYFNRRNGVLSYSMKEVWLTVKNPQSQTKPASTLAPASSEKKSDKVPFAPTAPTTEKKKAEDLFGNFGFGP